MGIVSAKKMKNMRLRGGMGEEMCASCLTTIIKLLTAVVHM